MTSQEQQLLQGLTDRVNQTVLNEKDPDAERYLQDTLGRNPDALYILAQTVLVQQYALDQAKQQLSQAKQQAPPAPKHATSFLGNLLGLNDSPPPPPPPQPQYSQVNNPPPQYVQQPQYSAAQYGSQPGFGQPAFGQQGGFLRSAMQTATGVAAGALAFQGIESLMHGFGEHAGYGQGLGGFGGGGGREEIINNNYYGDSSPHEHGDLSDRLAASGDQPSSDIEDRRDDFADTSSDDNASSNDDGSNDNLDDSGSYDDSSSDSGSDFGSDDNS